MENKRELQLKDQFEILLKKWWLILLLTAFGFVSVFIISVNFVTPVYQAETVLFIGTENNGLGNVDISVGSLSADSQLIVDYHQIALTRLVINEVIKNTNLAITYEDFRNNVVIQTVEDSRLFTVGFRSPDPTIAKTVSDELARQLTLAVYEIVGVENIRILDPAQIPQNPVSPNVLIYSLLGAFLGFLTSILAILILYLLDDTIKSESDIETLLGVTVLGTIPDFKEKV